MEVHISALPLKNHFKIFVTLAFPNKIKLSIDKKKVRYNLRAEGEAEIDAKRRFRALWKSLSVKALFSASTEERRTTTTINLPL